jgi:hypothetical protein
MTLDPKSLAVTEFLNVLKDCRDTLEKLRNKIRLRPEVKYANVGNTSFTGKPYHIVHLPNEEIEQFQCAVKFVVTATLQSTKIIEWLLEIYWNETRWLVETSIYIDSDSIPDHGMDLLQDFPERYATTLDELILQAKTAAIELVENVDAIDQAIALDMAISLGKVKQ